MLENLCLQILVENNCKKMYQIKLMYARLRTDVLSLRHPPCVSGPALPFVDGACWREVSGFSMHFIVFNSELLYLRRYVFIAMQRDLHGFVLEVTKYVLVLCLENITEENGCWTYPQGIDCCCHSAEKFLC